MNLYRVPIAEMTYAHVRALLDASARETVRLDYKIDFSSNADSIAKALASMANTYGGVIIFGVGANDDGTPKLPPKGIEGKAANPGEALANQAEASAINSIEPPLDVEVRALEIPDGDSAGRWVVVVRVPESHQAPHLLHSDNQILVRRMSQTGRIEFPPLDWIEHLLERRRGPERDREAMWAASLERVGRKWRGNTPPRTLWTFAVGRLYPREQLVNAPRAFRILEQHREHAPTIPRVGGAFSWEFTTPNDPRGQGVRLIDLDARGYYFMAASPNLVGVTGTAKVITARQLAHFAASSWLQGRVLLRALGVTGALFLRVELRCFDGWQVGGAGGTGAEPFAADHVRHDVVLSTDDFFGSNDSALRALADLCFGLGNPNVTVSWPEVFADAQRRVEPMPEPTAEP